MQAMSLLVAASFLTCLPVVGAIIWSGHRAMSPKRLSVTLDWLEKLSPERYKPMVRLLNRQDLDFLRSQPGFTRKMERGFRRQRCEIFRGYLRQLEGDFQQVCTALKLVMVQSNADRPDLAATLLRQQMWFKAGMLAVHFRLLLHGHGIGTVEVAGLLKLFDGMRLELRSLVPASAVWGA
jgi:hypothetical protein